MLKSSNGFSLIEVLVAFGIVTMLITTIFPISIQLKKDQQKLSDRISIVTLLYDELQSHIWEGPKDKLSYTNYYNNKQLTFNFSITNTFLKGCVEWTNVKNENEKECLFGYPN